MHAYNTLARSVESTASREVQRLRQPLYWQDLAQRAGSGLAGVSVFTALYPNSTSPIPSMLLVRPLDWLRICM